MKKIKMKKIRSFKLFIFLGLVLTMFTAFIINFKSFAYDSDDENHLINNNIFPCDNIYLNEGIVNGQFIGLYGAHHMESTNNIFKFVYTCDSRDLVNNRLTVYFETPHIVYDSNKYLFMYVYDDTANFSIGFKSSSSSSSYSYPITSDDYFTYNGMELYYSDFIFNYNDNIDIMQFLCYSNLEEGITYTWWFFLNVVPVESVLKDNSFNPEDVLDIFYSSQDTQNLSNQISNLQYDNNSLRSLNLDYLKQIESLRQANQVLSDQLANANNDYNLNNLVWSIGGTPFETFKTIWNFEFFGVNISNLIFGLLTGLIIIWIIKKFFL